MTVININDIINTPSPFDEVRERYDTLDIDVREFNYMKEIDLSRLYLVYAKHERCTPEQDEVKAHQFNGVILEKDTNKIVCMNHNKFNDLSDDTNLNNLNNLLTDTVKSIQFEYCEDGTMIRLYNYQDTWLTATTKCIDARHSYWNDAKSFGQMFWELFDESCLNALDKDCTYFFVLKHVDNRLVIKHTYSHLLYINHVNNITQEVFVDKNLFNKDYPSCIIDTDVLDVSLPTDKFITIPQLEELYNPTKRGIIVKIINKDDVIQFYQYDFDKFRQIVNVRGNVPLIRMRYLELLTQPDQLDLLENYYPEHFMIFTVIKHSLNNVYLQVHRLYIESHVKHLVTVDESHLYYQTLRQLHGIYKNSGNHITLDTVKTHINTLEPHVIKKFIGWV
jgi:hypothetical protein